MARTQRKLGLASPPCRKSQARAISIPASWMPAETTLLFCLVVGICLLVLAVSGCTDTDLSEYHVVTDSPSEPGTSGAAEKIEQSEAPPTTSTPPAAETLPETITSSDAPPSAPTNSSRDTSRMQIAAANPDMLRLDPSLGGVPGTPADPVAQALEAPRKIELLVPHKEFVKEGPEHALRVTFDDIDLLKVLNMEPVPPNVIDYLPSWLKELDGKRIVLRGWMFPSGRQTGITRFMFVRDNGICCFGRAPKVYDKLGVTMREGKTTHYIQGRPFDVIGTLTIEADVDGNDVLWLYHLDDAVVIEN